MPFAPSAQTGRVAARRYHLAPFAFAAVAAAAMVATLPGRTHGLGLITEPLLQDLRLDRVPYAVLNLWATLLGALFCIPCGWLLDRVGARAILSLTLLGLGGVVVAMSRTAADGSVLQLPSVDAVTGRAEWVGVPVGLFALVLLTRGLGQSALSTVSLALVGKASGKSPGPVIGFYSFLVSIGFMAAFGAVKVALESWGTDWRGLWAGIGWILVAAGVLAAVFVPNPAARTDEPSAPTEETGHTLAAAVRTPVFWVFGVATSLYGLIAAGVSLFNQSILAERNFDRSVFLTVTTLAPMIGLAANLATGWLATRIAMGRLLAVAMVVMAAALLAFPWVSTLTEVYAYATAMGISGGMVTVLFFAVWRQAFGTKHLGQIQGAAQLLTVLASAAGPVLLAAGHRASGSYVPSFRWLAAAALALAVVAWFTRVPSPDGDSKGNTP